MKKNQIFFVFIFTILGLIALQIPFTRLMGSNVKFTLFDFLAPTAGAFLGTPIGVFSVFLMQAVNYLLHGAHLDIGGIIRLFPTLFAVIYFSKKRTVNVIIPVLAIIGFNLHPIGRSAWQYSLFWLIPIVCHVFRKNLYLRSLGATFSAHAVGGILWVWAFGLTKEMWLALMPQTMIERTLMAGGITLSYITLRAMVKVLNKSRLFADFRVKPS